MLIELFRQRRHLQHLKTANKIYFRTKSAQAIYNGHYQSWNRKERAVEVFDWILTDARFANRARSMKITLADNTADDSFENISDEEPKPYYRRGEYEELEEDQELILGYARKSRVLTGSEAPQLYAECTQLHKEMKQFSENHSMTEVLEKNKTISRCATINYFCTKLLSQKIKKRFRVTKSLALKQEDIEREHHFLSI